jgi:magnesium transporter
MLIRCVAYQNGRKVADIAIHEIHGYPRSLTVSSGLRCGAERLCPERCKGIGLHPLAVEDSNATSGRRSRYADSLFVVPDDEPSEGNFASARSTFSPTNHVLRSGAERLRRIRERCEREPELRNGSDTCSTR